MDKNTINQRVVNAINYLIDQGIVKKKGAIAEVLQCSPQTITEILGGRQGMKIDMLQKFFDKFKVSYEYIFEGIGSILKEDSLNAQENAQHYALKTQISLTDSLTATPTRDERSNIYYEMYKEKDAQVNELSEKVGEQKNKIEILKEEILNLKEEITLIRTSSHLSSNAEFVQDVHAKEK